MTRKDYILISNILREYVGYASETEEDTVFMTHLCNDFASKLAGTNPLFDRKRFLEACGVETWYALSAALMRCTSIVKKMRFAMFADLAK